jgi:hypothetical protein
MIRVQRPLAHRLCLSRSRTPSGLADQQGLSGALPSTLSLPRKLDQLDLVGLDERRLFPDLGGLARELRRYYG